jgi:hypothetical protein
MAPITASAFDESKYPDFQGQWKRKPGTVNSWDETRRPGLPQDPPLTPEYRKRWEASMADQAAGGQGNDSRVTCISNGMPRMMTILRQLAIFIRPEMTLIVFENNLPRASIPTGATSPPGQHPVLQRLLDRQVDRRERRRQVDVLEVRDPQLQGPPQLRAKRAPAA